MNALANEIENKNFLSPLGFVFTLKRAPNINYFIQKANVPSMMAEAASIKTPFTNIPDPGLKPTFGNFNIDFKVSEDMDDYFELYNWFTAITDPDSGTLYKVLEDKPFYTGESIKSDISLIVLNSVKKPNLELTLVDAFPVFISDLEFDTRDPDVVFITASATFAYRRFYLDRVI